MSLRKFALVALSTAALSVPAFAQSEPGTPPSTAPDPVMPADPVAPPPTLPGEMPATPAAPTRTVADVDGELTTHFGEAESFKTFFADLQKAVAAEDKKAVAAMVSYPFKTKMAGEEKTFDNEAAFTRAYDDIMRPAMVVAIRDQTYETLTVTPQGVGIGSGEVWFAESGAGADAAVKIIAINQSTEAPS
jgi:hypothetical protein